VVKQLHQSLLQKYIGTRHKVVYVDASGCQNPEGMVYQVWALKLDPLTPTSIGLLENFDKMIKNYLL
jgi:hypothetical protein